MNKKNYHFNTAHTIHLVTPTFLSVSLQVSVFVKDTSVSYLAHLFYFFYYIFFSCVNSLKFTQIKDYINTIYKYDKYDKYDIYSNYNNLSRHTCDTPGILSTEQRPPGVTFPHGILITNLR